MLRLGSELTTNFVGVQPVDSPDVILVGFEPEWFGFGLLNLLELTPVT